MDQNRLLGPWLLGLCYEALGWIRKNSKPRTPSAPNIPTTSAYAELAFAFGLARLGEAAATRGLIEQAEGVLLGKDEIHEVLARGYRYRIDEALAGRPHAGPLPADLVEQVERLDKMRAFVVDRLRQHSRILEPDQRINPYRWGPWQTSDGLFRLRTRSYTLPGDCEEFASQVEKLLREDATGHNGNETWASVLYRPLNLAPRYGEEFARRILYATIQAYDRLPETDHLKATWARSGLLEPGLFVAARFGWWEPLQRLADRCRQLMASQPGFVAAWALGLLTGPYLRGLLKLGRRGDIDSLLAWVAQRALETQGLGDLQTLLEQATQDGPHLRDPVWVAEVRAVVQAASGWFYLGDDKQAETVLEAGRNLLFRPRLKPQDQTLLACSYAQSLGQAQAELARHRIEEMFERVDGIRDSFTTNSHYCMLQLNVIEAVVLAVIDRSSTAAPEPK
jgi:hypothetical protein